MPHCCPIYGPCMRAYMPHSLLPYMAMYARMHAPLLLPCDPCAPIYGPCMRACMPHCCSHVAHLCPHIWPMYEPITASKYGPFFPAYRLLLRVCIGYYCASPIRYKAWRFNRFANCPNLCTTQWSIYARIYRPYMGAAMGHACAHTWPYMGAYMGHMGAAMGHACAHTWPYMGAAMGHTCAHTWAIYGGIHGPHGSSNGAYMGAYMGHIWGHTWATWEQQWGMHARIYGHIWGQPYRESREEGNNK